MKTVGTDRKCTEDGRLEQNHTSDYIKGTWARHPDQKSGRKSWYSALCAVHQGCAVSRDARIIPPRQEMRHSRAATACGAGV